MSIEIPDDARATWQATGRVFLRNVLSPERIAEIGDMARAEPVAASLQVNGWLWFQGGPLQAPWLDEIATVATAVVGAPVVVGEACVRRFPRGAYADHDPGATGLVRFVVDVSTGAIDGGGRRFGDEVWPVAPRSLSLWWEDGVTPVRTDLVMSGERTEIVGVLGAPR